MHKIGDTVYYNNIESVIWDYVNRSTYYIKVTLGDFIDEIIIVKHNELCLNYIIKDNPKFHTGEKVWYIDTFGNNTLYLFVTYIGIGDECKIYNTSRKDAISVKDFELKIDRFDILKRYLSYEL